MDTHSLSIDEIERTKRDLHQLKGEVEHAWELTSLDFEISELDQFRIARQNGTPVGESCRNTTGSRYHTLLTMIRERFSIQSPVVYAPGHGPVYSHCEVFKDASKIFNLDPNPHSVTMMRERYQDRPEIESHLGIVQAFHPECEVDLCFATGVRFDDSEFDFRRFMKPGGLIVINANHPWPFTQSSDISFEGMTVSSIGRFSKKRPKPPIERQVKTEKDLLRAGTIEECADYGSVYRCVYEVKRSTASLLDSYAELREQAAEDMLDAIRLGILEQQEVCLYTFRKGSLAVRDEWRNADVFVPEDRARMKEILIDCGQLELRRNLKTYELLPLPESYFVGVSTNCCDLEVYRYRPLDRAIDGGEKQ